ncbi:MAG TPA: putative ABC transporter permease [Clostridium sp.]
MWEFKLLGTDLYHIIHWFFIYSFLGWLMETCYVAIVDKKLVNRGFVNGPVCTIYGFGALSVYFILKPFENNILILFIMGIIVTSILEYFTAWIMEIIFRTTWWDYSNYSFNIKGRICLLNSIIWGFLTVALFLFIQPFVNSIVSLYSVSTGKILGVIAIILYLVDYGTTSYYAMDLKVIINSMSDAMDELVSYTQSTKLYETKEEIIEYLEKSKPVEFINEVKEKLGKSIQLNKEKFVVLSVKYNTLKSKSNIIHIRLLKAFPNLKVKDKEKYVEELKSYIFKRKK